MFTRFSCFAFFCFLISSCAGDEVPEMNNNPSAPPLTKMDSLSARIETAKALQQKGDAAGAMAIADSILKKYPGQLDVLSLKAEILKTHNKNAEALAVLEKAYSLQPRDKELAYDLAYEYADQKNSKALPLTDTLLKYDKTETAARAWYIKATYYANIGKETEALKAFTTASTTDYNFIDAYLDKGQLLFKQKKFEEALKSFATGQKVSPASAEFYFWVAKTQEAMGDKADAKTNYERAYALDKGLTEAKEAGEKISL